MNNILTKSLPIDDIVGTLYLRYGSMYSSKSTWLNGELTQLADKGFSVVKIIHSDDIRDDVELCDESGSTHHSSFKRLTDKIKVIRASSLTGIDVTDYHVVGIDEGQFFPDLYSFVEHLVEKLGKHVRVVGLDGDFAKQPWGGDGTSNILSLIPLSDQAEKLVATCEICLQDLRLSGFKGNLLAMNAPFTKRIGTSIEQKVIGGHNEYIPVCRYHHRNA